MRHQRHRARRVRRHPSIIRSFVVSVALVAASCGPPSHGLGDANGAATDDHRSGVAASSDTESAGEDGSSGSDGSARTSAAASDLHGRSPSDDAHPAGGNAADSGDLGVGGVAISGDEGDGGRGARASESGVPGLDGTDRFEAALAAYWRLLDRARQEPWRYDEADLDAVAVGAGRDRFIQRIDNLGAAEAVVRRPESRFEVRLSDMRVGSDVAVGQECVLDDLVHVVARNPHTGERYDPPIVTDDRVFTNRYGVTFQRDGDVWKVADRVQLDGVEGVAGCAGEW